MIDRLAALERSGARTNIDGVPHAIFPSETDPGHPTARFSKLLAGATHFAKVKSRHFSDSWIAVTVEIENLLTGKMRQFPSIFSEVTVKISGISVN
jgi:hypothetical protein